MPVFLKQPASHQGANTRPAAVRLPGTKPGALLGARVTQGPPSTGLVTVLATSCRVCPGWAQYSHCPRTPFNPGSVTSQSASFAARAGLHTCQGGWPGSGLMEGEVLTAAQKPVGVSSCLSALAHRQPSALDPGHSNLLPADAATPHLPNPAGQLRAL